MRKDSLRWFENFLRQPGEARDLNAVAFVRGPGSDLAQNNDLLVPFTDREVEVGDTAAIGGELG